MVAHAGDDCAEVAARRLAHGVASHDVGLDVDHGPALHLHPFGHTVVETARRSRSVVSFVAVECPVVLFGEREDDAVHIAAREGLDGRDRTLPVASIAPETHPVPAQHGPADDAMAWAARGHLDRLEVRAVGEIEGRFHRRGHQSVTPTASTAAIPSAGRPWWRMPERIAQR